MDTTKQAPRSLKIVAALFVLSGVLAAVEVLVSLAQGHVSINFGVLGIFIGQGLLRFQPAWRTWALLFTWLDLIVIPLFLLAVALGHCPTYLSLFGQRIADIPPELAALACLCFFAFGVWQYRVLTREETVRLFLEAGS